MDVEQRYVISYYLRKCVKPTRIIEKLQKKKNMYQSPTNVQTYTVGLESLEVHFHMQALK